MQPFDAASLAAAWLAVLITAIGLGSLITQVAAYRSLLDPFHGQRGPKWHGPWADDDESRSWLLLKKPIPRGPIIEGKYIEGLCKLNVIHVKRRPVRPIGRASWTSILQTFNPASLVHPQGMPTETIEASGLMAVHVDSSWRSRLPTHALRKHRDKPCTTITRTAFIICVVLANAYQIYKYSGSAGLRVAYSGYTGTWELHWPLGGSAEVEFVPLDSHEESSQEMHPRTFPRRVD